MESEEPWHTCICRSAFSFHANFPCWKHGALSMKLPIPVLDTAPCVSNQWGLKLRTEEIASVFFPISLGR